MHRKAVAQGVRRNFLGDLCLFLIVFDDLPETLTAHALTVHVHKQRRLVIIGNDTGTDVLDIILQRFHSGSIQRNNAFLISCYAADEANRQVDIVYIESDQLRHTNTGSVKQLQHGVVAEPLLIHALGLLQEQLHFLTGEYLGILALHLYTGKSFGRVGLHSTGRNHEVIEGLNGGGRAGNGGRGFSFTAQVFKVFCDTFLFHFSQIAAAFKKPGVVLVNIPHIGAERIGLRMLFLNQICMVCRNVICHRNAHLLQIVM